jgi:triosephosphate isomerase
MRPLIADNWKMHGMAPQLAEVARMAAALCTAPAPADALICPPAALLTRAGRAAAGGIAIGGQNCAAEYTGLALELLETLPTHSLRRSPSPPTSFGEGTST